LCGFAVIIYLCAEPIPYAPYTTIAFLIGGFTSILAGYLGMKVAVYTNVRTTKECATSVHDGFIVAFRGGQVLGFTLVGLALFVLLLILEIYMSILITEDSTDDDYVELFEMVAGYGLGASTVALFGRVGGGIYTKAADVGADLAGKVVQGLEEDDPSNPGVIADNVGDNVGDIAGMGADLFGSLAEATCAALVVSATSPEIIASSVAIYFPLLVTSCGIFVSFITTFFASNFTKITFENVESTLKWQLIISTILMTGALFPIIQVLPENF
jgi:Na+/H+-translocating membrane pyrophosphatase